MKQSSSGARASSSAPPLRFDGHGIVNNQVLAELALVGNGSDFASVVFTGPADSSPDQVEYFRTTNPVHITFHGAQSDLTLIGGRPSMTVTSLEVTKNGEPLYELHPTSFQLSDLYHDAGDNGVLDTLPAQIFKGNDEIFGLRGDQVLFGFAGNDAVLGGNDDDVLFGGLGNDTLAGGNGHDVMVFDTALDAHKNVDLIENFRRIDDDIDLENSIFTRLKHEGPLKEKYFHLGKSAADHNDYIIYNHDTGNLFYDRDGDGPHKKILFASLEVSGDHAPRLHAEDLFVT
jgi:Ca2+-binding RTX toxin-like protein